MKMKKLYEKSELTFAIVWIVVMILINMGLAEVERVTKRQ